MKMFLLGLINRHCILSMSNVGWEYVCLVRDFRVVLRGTYCKSRRKCALLSDLIPTRSYIFERTTRCLIYYLPFEAPLPQFRLQVQAINTPIRKQWPQRNEMSLDQISS